MMNVAARHAQRSTTAALALLTLFASPVAKAEPGNWKSITSADGLVCCDHADGEDVLWEADANGYRVFVFDHWVSVPGRALVTEPNWYGTAVVWLDNFENNGQDFRVRCFWPGAGL